MCIEELVLITSCFNGSHEGNCIDGTEVLKLCELHYFHILFSL